MRQSKAKQCAYCSSAGPFTREHLTPRFIHKRIGKNIFINIKTALGAEKILLGAEPTIADVCQACNNGPLSQLDTYLSTIFDEFFSEWLQRSPKAIFFRYDYDLLLRCLMKLCFNMARSRVWDSIGELEK